jgi:hypothetical protein
LLKIWAVGLNAQRVSLKSEPFFAADTGVFFCINKYNTAVDAVFAADAGVLKCIGKYNKVHLLVGVGISTLSYF